MAELPNVPNDTDEKFQEFYYQKLSEMPPEEKLLRTMQLWASARELSKAGIRQRYPNASEEEVTKRLGVLTVGKEITKKYFN